MKNDTISDSLEHRSWLSRVPAFLLFKLHGGALHQHMLPDRALRLFTGSVAVFAFLFAGSSCRVVNDDTPVVSSMEHT
ncbi:MAG: hypothetical protein U9P42_09640, partial [Candidatus Fermentibacteria bacterium]|nr:hypothetical protein [Candidatus Fermentibacteria bacterium]